MNLYAKVCLAAFLSTPLLVSGQTSIFAHIEAEEFSKSNVKSTGCEGTCVADLKNGDFLGYRAVDFGPGGITEAINFRYSKTSGIGGYVEIRLGDPTGQIVGEFAPIGTEGVFKEATITLSDSVEGVQYLYFVGVSSNSDPILSLDWVELGNLEFTQKIWTVCGSLGECGEGQFVPADVSETHEVRCCSDTEKPGWTKHPWCGVWAESDLPTCYHAQNFTSALKICNDNGARLCTKVELEAKCTQNSGCEHDRDLVWSSSAHDDPDGHWVGCGSPDSDCKGQEHFAWDNEIHEVSCCSDTPLSSGDKLKCSEKGVYGYSEMFNKCFHGETYGAAEMICSNLGGRLCTRSELRAGCTKGTGCDHDKDLIWTSDVFGTGNVVESDGSFSLNKLVTPENHGPFVDNEDSPLFDVIGKYQAMEETTVDTFSLLSIGGTGRKL